MGQAAAKEISPSPSLGSQGFQLSDLSYDVFHQSSQTLKEDINYGTETQGYFEKKMKQFKKYTQSKAALSTSFGTVPNKRRKLHVLPARLSRKTKMGK